ncbi:MULTISPECIES: molybdenum cofactor biosynthesis protein MoaE [Curtobacterium]|uniref:molybdenum cofactor biosynthesis protein MoaE n=1 Tax=Curtobacterium TaxID=2034 RepID=UPI000DA6F714|nr:MULTISPECIES: molybdenum cofactor biosynthesis protein MoaE [Curtobacterium]MBY0178229.1 molybdenum cofactor biosynthesis protein MoaE [Curtobacterium herbarum]MCP1504377.1 molybdopterin synthase catalytic subunit [Curtobacterium herbarum]MDN4647258.1 molybdenum cofactor biosynthesis protein MoaE [Curtobacterium sp. PsM8]WIE62208.1 molybdenum cofactor biosynthesis protein MoaE [Curtobacterium sp. MCLR17_032]
MSGTAAERVVVADVVDRDITVDEVSAVVASDQDGAVVTFAGVVRDHDGGKGVTALEYERHPSAGDVIASVARSIAEQHPEVRIAVLHRVGALGIGDVALAAAVASGHRAEAFAACGALVDLVKEQVPIWKHQRFTDGSDEWVAAL